MPEPISRTDRIFVVALAVILILVGIPLADDFGVSWDEPDNAIYGQQALDAYRTLEPLDEWHSNLESKGPLYFAFSELIAVVLSPWFPDPGVFSARHFAFSISLPLAAIGFFFIVRLLVSTGSAIPSTLLFIGQPLIFGHAFINPKDTPFMAFFLLSVAAGLYTIEKSAAADTMKGSWWQQRLFMWMLLSGLLLGVAISIRIFGLFAGFLVAVAGLMRLRGKFILPASLYGLATFTMVYLTWPYLWGDPIGHLAESLQVMADFPWDNIVLYRRLLYPMEQLPWHYLPFITLIQLTIPAILASLIGAIAWLLSVGDLRSRNVYPLILILWITIPFGYAVLSGSSAYDNGRHFLFALPPVFMISGYCFEKAFDQIRPVVLRVGLVVALLAPGVFWILRLHPYEYIFKNALVGYVRGAFREYELDYWALAYREAMEEINGIAPHGSTIRVTGPWRSAEPFARPDLKVLRSGSDPDQSQVRPDFYVISTRSNGDLLTRPSAEVIYTVEVQGAGLAVIKQ
jgi:hypothetical protein